MATDLQRWLIALGLALFLVFVEGNSQGLVYCVHREGRNTSDCLDFVTDVDGCCNSLSLLLTKLYVRYGHGSGQIPPQMIIEIRSNLNLSTTVDFKNMSGVEVRGVNNPEITCLESNGEMNAGLYFKNVSNIKILELSFLNCGSLQESTSQYNRSAPDIYAYFHTSLYFLQCTNLTLRKVSISHGQGIGAALFNVAGRVNINCCIFENNQVNHTGPSKHRFGGGGLYIELTNCTSWKNCSTQVQCRNSHYTIQNCSFQNNTANMSRDGIHITSKPPFQGFGRGGGLALYLNGCTKQCSVTIERCLFHNNFAVVGGGMFIMFRFRPSENNITVKDSDFVNNTALIYSKQFSGQIFRSGGGGGVGGGFLFHESEYDDDPIATNNKLKFTKCRFIGNTAGGSGGGLTLFSTKRLTHKNISTNVILLESCEVTKNTAYVASALDFAPEIHDRLGGGLLPVPILKYCRFIDNYVRNHNIPYKSSYFNVSLNGIITVFISSFHIKFSGVIVFQGNSETALHLSSATVTFTTGSSVSFIDNHGKYGGAVTMLGFSVIYVKDKCHLKFINNTAIARGGAFYVHSSDYQHEAHFSISCFIQYKGETNNSNDRNITFLFQNNSALSGVGHLLYATSLLPCDQNNTFFSEHIKSAIPQTNSSTVMDIATLTYDFIINETTIKRMQSLVPGIDFDMNITALDEFRQSRMETFYAHIVPAENITVDQAYTQVSNSIIKVHGDNHKSTGILTLESQTASISVKIKLGKCPPGFLNVDKSCVCSPSSILGASRCINSSVYLVRGFWVGQCPSKGICSAHCPAGYCFNKNSNSEEFQLPSKIDEIDHFICGPNFRTGTLCGECANGSSVQYHSHDYLCKPNKYCNIGIVFYLLSEIVPLVIFFLIITMFNISFTSGALNGFILFAQMSDAIDMDAGGTVDFPHPAEVVTYPYKLIYRMFNFDFFSLDALSFCLWKHATTMDALIMKFATIAFALLLIILIIFVFNTWKFRVWCHWFRPRTLKAAFTHGLSTLLIVSFSQCASVSFLILLPTQLYRVEGKSHTIPVVFYSGNLQPFVGKHLQYAIPAVFFLLILVILPLLWLLSYPLLFKILGMCRMSESKLSSYLSRLFPIQLLDSFQSCFKDDHRYFAGLYFLYRFIPLVIFANVHRLLLFHAMLSVQFLIMLTLHSVIQPYKSKYHNIIDSFILANISLVNTLTMYNYAVLSTGDQEVYKLTVHWIIYLQIVLMYCPLICLLYCCATEVYFRLKMQCKGYLSVSSEDTDLLPPLRDS